MRLTSYKSVLDLPGMRMFMLVALIARIPGTTPLMTLTLYVVLNRHQGYGDAGLVSAAFTIGLALGSPLLGRAIDRRGCRPALALTGTATLVFWNVAPSLPFPALLGAAVAGGALQVPVMGLIRQSLAARVPREHRRQAFSLDSMAVELSFMVGPALAILLVTQLGGAVPVMRGVGLALAGSAVVLYAYNPRTGDRSSGAGEAEDDGQAPARWFTPAFVLILGVCAATCMVLAGTDVSIVATLRAHGQTAWAGAVITIWCLASLIGGFVHGATPRPLRMLTLLTLLGLATIPVGVAHTWWALAIVLIPAGLACAPTIASTVEAVSHAVPESARGEAIGRHSAALTFGNAVGSPFVGMVIDHSAPAWGFAAVGTAGLVLALAAMLGQSVVGARSRARDAELAGA
jgi:MFS family permease